MYMYMYMYYTQKSQIVRFLANVVIMRQCVKSKYRRQLITKCATTCISVLSLCCVQADLLLQDYF